MLLGRGVRAARNLRTLAEREPAASAPPNPGQLNAGVRVRQRRREGGELPLLAALAVRIRATMSVRICRKRVTWVRLSGSVMLRQ